MNRYNIYDNIYKKHFKLIVNCSHEELVAYLKKLHAKRPEHAEALAEIGDYPGCAGLCIHGLHPFYYVWAKEFGWSIYDQAVLIHELHHHVDFTLDSVGIQLRRENTEVSAYYMEYIFKKVWAALKPLHAKKKRRT